MKKLKLIASYVCLITILRKHIKIFMRGFYSLYDSTFPKESIKLKAKNVLNPWITIGIPRSSKKKNKIKAEKRKSLQNIKIFSKK